ncbi:MAG TPA: LacI family transcriptional regulator [Firmicutes bacterium]|nr:LacI family transcriptional regulator [Bacillota bacterium]
MATIKDIAKKVGVSNATVSRVLNHDEGISVSQEKREDIFRVANELGYKKKVVNPKIENVALLYWICEEEELQDIYFNAIFSELIEQCKQKNISLQLYKKEDGVQAIKKETNAFIAIGYFNRKELDYLQRVTSNGIFIDSAPDEKYFDSVRPNLNSIVTQIVDYLVEKEHQKIGFIGCSDPDIETSRPTIDIRESSFTQRANYHSVYDEKAIFITDQVTVAQGYRLGQLAIEKLGDELPTAFCVASDTLAIGVLQAFHEAKIDVPSRVAFFSINDTNVSQYVSPPLTTFHIDIPLLCESAIDLLQERMIKGRQITKTVSINGVPVFRKSC